jgi:hypothetical protein
MQQADQAGLEPPDLEPLDSDQMPRRGLAHQADGSPTAKSQTNHRSAEGFAYTDPDRHIMKGNGEMMQVYNCQAVVNGAHRWSAHSPTPEHPRPPSSPTLPIGVTTTRRSVLRHRQMPTSPPAAFARPTATGLKRPKDLVLKRRMARKLRINKGREVYAKRKTIPDPVFGQTNETRGLRCFLLRALEKVNGEWTLWGITHKGASLPP